MAPLLRCPIIGLLMLLATCAVARPGPEARLETFVPAKRWAVVVGANRYTEMGALRYAVNDAKAFGRTLEETFRFDASTIKYLLDEEGGTAPTAANVLGALDALVSDPRLDRGDLFVFYFAGHGVGTPEGDFLLPSDGTRANAATKGVSVKALIGRMVQAGLKNVLVIADACRNGDKNGFGRELAELGRRANIAVLLGTAPGGRSYEIPQFQHGVFTHFLLKRLTDPELRSKTTGALWSSAVAERTRDDVVAYTERDFGDDAQQPTVFAERTQDVLLGAFVDSSLPVAGLAKAFAAESKGLTKARMGASLTQMGTALLLARRFDLAIEMYVTADQLGEATPATLFHEGGAMLSASRWSEAERVFTRLREKDGTPYYAALATLASRDPKLAPQQRLDAASKAFHLDRSEEVALMAFAGLSSVAPVQRRAFVGELRKAFPPATRVGAFFAGVDALDAGKDSDAVVAFDRSLMAPGKQPSANQIRGMKLVAWLGTATETQIRLLIDDAIADGDDQAMWLLLRADRHQRAGEFEEAMADTREALANDPDPAQMLEAVRHTLADCGKLNDLLAPLAAAHPYAWEAQLAAGLSAWAASDWTDAGSYQETVEKYAPDLLTAKLEHYGLLDDIIRDRMKRKGLDEIIQFRLRTLFAIDLGKLASQFGKNEDAWFKFEMYSLDSNRVLPLAVTVYRLLVPLVHQGEANSGLRRVAMVAAMTGGDDEEVDRLWSPTAAQDGVEPDLGWYYATYLACRGRYAEADRIRADLPPPRPGTLAQTFESASLLIDAGLGKTGDVKKRVQVIGENIPSARQLQGMALLLAGDWEGAEQRLYLAAKEMGWSFRWVADTAILRLAAAYGKRGQVEDLKFLRAVATTRAETRFFERLAFAEPPELQAFVGTYEFEVSTVFDGEPIEKIEMTIAVEPDGRARLSRKGEGSAGWRVEGRVNAYGDLQGTFDDGKHKARFGMKLPPVAEYKTYPLLATTGIYLKMVDENGRYGFWIAKPRR
ncbi:MAG: caspase family protein [Fimbriimonadaceae bacterium]|nr:caspase family protein [Fimbriimonadaceae bacterium]